jgi:tRNA1Val (adenine37-N6)-methyltransferase
MPNNWFRFKQFLVKQDVAGMKVSTDACILGAIASNVLSTTTHNFTNVLDIGTGTGLLSLMIAQNNYQLNFHAVDINLDSVQQAKENFENSPWSDRLNAMLEDITVTKTKEHKYDVIICNPPFFINQLNAHEAKRNMARHTSALTPEVLVRIIEEKLSDKGLAFVLYPSSMMATFIEFLKDSHLETVKLVNVFPNYSKAHNRSIIVMCKKVHMVHIELERFVYIREGLEYTQQFKDLMKDFYL